MANKKIEKSIGINAAKEKVWQVLLNDQYTRQWFAEFSEGTYAVTDWTIGSKAVFKDKSETGMIGKIIENKPNEILIIEYIGIVAEGGIEDYDSDMARKVKGGRESYFLAGEDSHTNLSISGEGGMSEEFFDSMSSAWDKAIQKIKSLSESI